MIDVDKVFNELFDTIPQHYSNSGLTDEVFYHLGDQDELNKVLITKQHNQQKAYPLIWYNLPNELKENSIYVNGDFEFVVAHNTNVDWSNDQRFNFSYKEILYPISDLIIQAFRGAKNIQLNELSRGVYWKRIDYPNYGSFTQNESPQDYWDALLLKVNLTIFSNRCMGNINYRLENFELKK